MSEISPPSLLYNGNGFHALQPRHEHNSNSAKAPHAEPSALVPPAADVSPPEYITHTPEEPAHPPNSAKAPSMKSAVQEKDGKKEMVFPAEDVLETPEGVFGLLPSEVTDKIIAPLGRMDRRALMATNSKVFEIVSDCVATIVISRHDRSLLNPSREIVHIHPEAGTLVRGFSFAAHDPESSPLVAQIIGYNFESPTQLSEALVKASEGVKSISTRRLEIIGCPYTTPKIVQDLQRVLPRLEHVSIHDCPQFSLDFMVSCTAKSIPGSRF